jgi:hypothetical protein
MALPEVRMTFCDGVALTRELDQNIRHGRAFLTLASDVPVLSECVLVLVHPEHGAELRLAAQVVMVNASGPMCGMGLALRDFGTHQISQVEQFAASPSSVGGVAMPSQAVLDHAERAMAPAAATLPGTLADSDKGSARSASVTNVASPVTDTEDGEPSSADADVESRVLHAPLDASAAPDEAATRQGQGQGQGQGQDVPDPVLDDAKLIEEALALEHEQDSQLEESELEAGQRASGSDLQAESKQAKLRHLNAAQQLKVARTGELSDRVAVERLYGKQVWEALLHNPRLSIPEVARIARKGTVPKPLLELIVENGAWIKAAAVRRALLSNPKIGSDSIAKLLRITPKHELKIIEKGTAYGNAVRDAARKLLRQ